MLRANNAATWNRTIATTEMRKRGRAESCIGSCFPCEQQSARQDNGPRYDRLVAFPELSAGKTGGATAQLTCSGTPIRKMQRHYDNNQRLRSVYTIVLPSACVAEKRFIRATLFARAWLIPEYYVDSLRNSGQHESNARSVSDGPIHAFPVKTSMAPRSAIFHLPNALVSLTMKHVPAEPEQRTAGTRRTDSSLR